ncbi:MAG: SLC13 family permease [Verrucomicrobia bacterium]|nr:SLC13 family permease [Verrucomicrobiota bacterium]MDA1068297.1 SLC13 family permease [Verrucomicrobiota bacterium]
MTSDQVILFILVILIFAFLMWGRFRYDLVAFSALLIALAAGVVPKEEVFSGFGHPAVVIVALVLIVSRGLSRSGAIELLAQKVIKGSRGQQAHIGIMASISAALSSIMNNVAALALLMPIDIQAARRAKRSPAITLMPLSFASILGGMVTLIGTPTNIVIAIFREDALGEPYGMFDFAPVGIVVAIAGILFVTLIGWRLIPVERGKHDTGKDLLDLKGYLAEAKVPETSKTIGKSLRDLDDLAVEYDVNTVGLVHRGKRVPGLARDHAICKGDLIVIEGGPEAIDQFVGAAGLEFVKSEKFNGITAEALVLMEVVVPDGARIGGRSAVDLRLLHRQGVTLLGISRGGTRIRERIRKERIQVGDILLLLGQEDQLPDVAEWLGCLPIAERGLEVKQRSKAWTAVGVFAAAIISASFGWVYLPLALAAVVIVYVLLKIVPLNQVYGSVEWSVIVLLGSMIPIGAALETSGGTAIIAEGLLNLTSGLPVVAVLTLLMIVTMTLSDVLNNVATALIAAPIGIGIAQGLNANPDSFLMAVAVAASCAFLTPIGHKNNTIIMGPGGYKFGDYWRMGLPLEILVIAVSIPVILIVWPL